MDACERQDPLITELFGKMCANPDLCGKFERTGDAITWALGDGFTVNIARDFLGISNKGFFGLDNELTHWHPLDEELYGDVCQLGTVGNVTVIHTTPLFDGVVYSGPAAGCKRKAKWLFGRYYYIRAEK